jgi:hypothetical protein
MSELGPANEERAPTLDEQPMGGRWDFSWGVSSLHEETPQLLGLRVRL